MTMKLDIDHDFPSMFKNAPTNQYVDPSTLHDAIKNVIKRWGFGLKVEE